MTEVAAPADEPQWEQVHSGWLNRCHFGDCIETMCHMPAGIVQTCVTSPPYFGLRDYGHEWQIGLEPTPDAYVAKLVEVFREVRRVLRDDGTLWINLGDSYAGGTTGRRDLAEFATSGGMGNKRPQDGQKFAGSESKQRAVPEGLKPKDLIGIPWRVAFALQADGWYLRQDIIWSKPNPMPESVTDRCTKAHEYIFLLSKSATYHYDHDAVKEPQSETSGGFQARGKRGVISHGGSEETARLRAPVGSYDGTRNKRSVWTVASEPYSGAHFATFPRKLIEPCILAGAPVGGVVLDPFFGSGTTGQVAQDLGRRWIACELNLAYERMQFERVAQTSFLLEAAA